MNKKNKVEEEKESCEVCTDFDKYDTSLIRTTPKHKVSNKDKTRTFDKKIQAAKVLCCSHNENYIIC